MENNQVLIDAMMATMDGYLLKFLQKQLQLSIPAETQPNTADQSANKAVNDDSEHSHKVSEKQVRNLPNQLLKNSLVKAKNIGQYTRPKERRERFNPGDTCILEAEFERLVDWNITLIKDLSQKLGVTQRKVYKWHYDRKKRAEREQLRDLIELKNGDALTV